MGGCRWAMLNRRVSLGDKGNDIMALSDIGTKRGIFPDGNLLET